MKKQQKPRTVLSQGKVVIEKPIDFYERTSLVVKYTLFKEEEKYRYSIELPFSTITSPCYGTYTKCLDQLDLFMDDLHNKEIPALLI